jgi:hypothetical protein
MSADALISRLDGVKRTGPGRWLARCPAHEDRSPSLSIRELEDSRVLVHCFASCSVEEVLSAVGLEMDVLFPPTPIEYGKLERRPFPAADVLRCLAFEALVVATAGAALLTGSPPFSEADRERLMLAVSRIQEALSAAGLAHG